LDIPAGTTPNAKGVSGFPQEIATTFLGSSFITVSP